MLFLIMLLLALLGAALLPLQIRTDVCRGQQRLMRLRVTLAGMTREWRFESVQTPTGREVIISGGLTHRPAHIIRPDERHRTSAKRFLHSLRHNPTLRRFVRRRVHVRQADVQVLLHAPGAASTALATGALRALFMHLPLAGLKRTRIRVLPDFFGGCTTIRARCIFRLRLGTLLITAALLFLDRLSQGLKREVQTIWNTPSEP